MPYKSIEDRRAASRRHYAAHTAECIQRSLDFNQRRRSENLELVRAAKSGPCIDCGQSFSPWVMQFDHVRGDKLGNVADLSNCPVSKAVLLAEIEKCDLVCANCHADRTHERATLGDLGL